MQQQQAEITTDLESKYENLVYTRSPLLTTDSGETDQENLLDIQCYEWMFKDWSDQLEMTIRLYLHYYM